MFRFLFIFLLPVVLFAARGDLVSYKKVSSLSLDQTNALIKQYSMEELFPAKNGLDFYQIVYRTRGLTGQETIASGMIVVPHSNDCTFSLLAFQHGTMPTRFDVPSRLNFQVLAAAAAFASGGYLTAATDYLGLGESPTLVHPYCHIESMSTAAVDILRAARNLSNVLNVSLDERLFVTGYSQGGLGAMALHKEIQENYDREFIVTASAPMAGPYDLARTTMHEGIVHPVPATSLYLSFILLGYNFVYEDIFTSLSQAIKEPYASLVPNLFDGRKSLEVITSALPATLQDLLTPTFINDDLENSNSNIYKLLADNSVYNWLPKAPMMIIGAKGDHDVPFANAELAYKDIKENGGDVKLTNVGDSLTHVTGRSPCHVQARKFFDTMPE